MKYLYFSTALIFAAFVSFIFLRSTEHNPPMQAVGNKYPIDQFSEDLRRQAIEKINMDKSRTANEVERQVRKWTVLRIGNYEMAPDEKENLERTVFRFLHVSTDDLRLLPHDQAVIRYESLDVSARRKFFTEKGWQDYSHYLLSHNLLFLKYGGGDIVCEARIQRESEKLLPAQDNRITFRSEGKLEYSRKYADISSGIIPFVLDMTFLPQKKMREVF